jgi:hypothetical protein
MRQLFIQPLTEFRPTNATSTSLNTPGDVIRYGNNEYKYVQYKAESVAAITPADGTFVVYDGTNTTQVTPDVSVGGSSGAGVLLGAPTDLYYCWIQTKGKKTLAHALVSGANGNALTTSATTDGSLKVSALVTDFPFALCLDATNKIVLLNCPA